MIRVNENYVIDADDCCYTLFLDRGEKRITEINGKKVVSRVRKTIGYFSSLQRAVQAVLDAEVRKYTAEGEKSLYQANAELKTMLEKLTADITGAIPTAEVKISPDTKGEKT